MQFREVWSVKVFSGETMQIRELIVILFTADNDSVNCEG